MPVGANGGLGINPNSSMSQARRIRNKNPNCNHNSNSVFYQPHYNNVKYDDSHKKKEDVLIKVFFKECAKEEEKRLFLQKLHKHLAMFLIPMSIMISLTPELGNYINYSGTTFLLIQ